MKGAVQATLAMAITIGFFGVLLLMLYGLLDIKENSSLLILLGSLGTSWGSVVNYYFGSSIGSAKKDELLANK